MENWKKEFSDILSVKIRHYIKDTNICSDTEKWYEDKPKRPYSELSTNIYKNSCSVTQCLLEYHPLIILHHKCLLYVIIPLKDYKKLNSREITPEEYISYSFWNYGYFWRELVSSGGYFWQPLEFVEPGIHDTEKISRYLNILNCQTNYLYHGFKLTESECNLCHIDNCPFNSISVNKTPITQQYDYRIDLYKAIAKRITDTFGFQIGSFVCQTGNTILITPFWDKELITVHVPIKLINFSLYFPGKRDFEKIVNNLKFEIGFPRKIDSLFINEDSHEFCYKDIAIKFWRTFPEFNNYIWVMQSNLQKISSKKLPEKTGFFHKFFEKIFH